MRRRYWAGAVVLGVVVLAGAWAVRWAERPKTLPVPLPAGGRIELDQTPFGEAAFHADRLTAEFRAALAPGRYEVGGPGPDAVVLDVPADTTAAGSLDLRVADRGEGGGRRWVAVRAEPSRLTFSNPVRVTAARGWVADLRGVSADAAGLAATAEPLVGRSVANWVADRVWSASGGGTADRPASPVREVVVTTGRLTLREGGHVRWLGAARDDASRLGVGPGSAVEVRDLSVTGTGEITAGRLAVRLAVGAGSVVRAGGVEVRAGGGEVAADLAVRRTADGTRVALAGDGPGAVRLRAVRVTPAPGVPDLAADRLDVAVERADWAHPHGGEPSAAVRTGVRVTGLAVPASPALAGLRVESVTAAVSGEGDAVRLDGVTVRVPKADVLAAARAALPKSVPLPDQPVADNVVDLFRGVRLAGLAVDLGQPALGYEGGRVVFSARPVVRGQVQALGRHDVVTMRVQEVGGPLGIRVRTNLPYHEVSWVPRVAAPFSVPLSVSGGAAVDLVPGPTLAGAALRIRTVCEAAAVGEPTVEGLPGPIRPLVQLAARFRDQIRVDGKTPAEYVKAQLTREDTVPLFGPAPDPRTAAVLGRVTVGAPRVAEDGPDLVVTASLGWTAR